MICTGCRRWLLARFNHRGYPPHKTFHRTASTDHLTSNAAQLLVPHPNVSMEATPAASSTSPSSSRPFSMSPSPQSPTDSEQGALQKTRSQPTPVVRGSLPGGAELHGLGYLKSTPKVYAKEDDEYPTWLWRLLDGGKVGEKKVDLAGEFML